MMVGSVGSAFWRPPDARLTTWWAAGRGRAIADLGFRWVMPRPARVRAPPGRREASAGVIGDRWDSWKVAATASTPEFEASPPAASDAPLGGGYIAKLGIYT